MLLAEKVALLFVCLFVCLYQYCLVYLYLTFASIVWSISSSALDSIPHFFAGYVPKMSV